jgi:regulator of sigma E protease
MTILAFLFVIAICVISHEWGHYITARLFGVQVHEFAFGMGPVLCSRKRWNTLWTFRIFPVGGFVRLAGMGEERDNEELLPGGGFFEKSAWQRFLILSAGAALNILLAVGITAFLLMTRGVMDLKSTTIGEIMTEYPAAEAGLRQGDTILAVNDEPTTSWEFMAKALREAGHQGTVRILVEREVIVYRGNRTAKRSPIRSFPFRHPSQDHYLSLF